MSEINLELLNEKMIPSWRIQSFSKDHATASFVAYIDARDVMNILDKVVGPENWQCDYREIKGNLFCGIGIFLNGQWVWKWDVGDEPDKIEKSKGEASDSFKRASVKWSIARWLYDLPVQYIKTNEVKTNSNFPYPIDENGNKIKDFSKFLNNKLGFTKEKLEKKTEKVTENKFTSAEKDKEIDELKIELLNQKQKVRDYELKLAEVKKTEHVEEQEPITEKKEELEKVSVPPPPAAEKVENKESKIDDFQPETKEAAKSTIDKQTETIVRVALKEIDKCPDIVKLKELQIKYSGLSKKSEDYKTSFEKKLNQFLNEQLEKAKDELDHATKDNEVQVIEKKYSSLTKHPEYKTYFEELLSDALKTIADIELKNALEKLRKTTHIQDVLKLEHEYTYFAINIQEFKDLMKIRKEFHKLQAIDTTPKQEPVTEKKQEIDLSLSPVQEAEKGKAAELSSLTNQNNSNSSEEVSQAIEIINEVKMSNVPSKEDVKRMFDSCISETVLRDTQTNLLSLYPSLEDAGWFFKFYFARLDTLPKQSEIALEEKIPF